MPFGLTKSPIHFSGRYERHIPAIAASVCSCFFYDILVYSLDWPTHLTHLREVLQVLSDNMLFLKISKCSFGVTSVEYLGHIISDGLVSADPSKIQSMMDWPTPSSPTALRGFLGLRVITGDLFINTPPLLPR
ncbi:hypothetical protein Salat_2630800 [Sesamum alatum]|uniref:Reverse transcriptase domain-containing protein n=1 Tax=Sesamum alatum TaxID=300844 RepID=A0AAE2CAX7_9LAMI|nr:hypothetical protein Salat_2630800 [Sesamum alatum]